MPNHMRVETIQYRVFLLIRAAMLVLHQFGSALKIVRISVAYLNVTWLFERLLYHLTGLVFFSCEESELVRFCTG